MYSLERPNSQPFGYELPNFNRVTGSVGFLRQQIKTFCPDSTNR